MIGLIITLAILGVFLIFVISASYYAYRSAFYAKGSKAHVSGYFEKSGSLIPIEDDIRAHTNTLLADEYEDVFITAYDGVKLHARYYHANDGAPVEIFMHGYKGNPFRSMSGLYKIAKESGHNVLIADQRGCGKSGGKAVTFGIKERYDTRSWVEYVSGRFSTDILLVGISLGGASVLMANDGTLPDCVKGVIADCPFSSPVGILKKVCQDSGVPSAFFPFVVLGALLFAHFNPYSSRADTAVKKATVPILILHGEDDGFVPISMAEDIYNSCASKKYIYRFPGADHAVCYFVDKEGYKKAVSDFTFGCLNS